MHKAPDRYAATTSVFYVMELMQDRGPNQAVAAVLSIPGHEGTFARRWRTTDGRLNELQVEDLVAWLTTEARSAILSWTGSQGVLPME